MQAKQAISGALAFDVDQPLSGAQAAAFVAAGYSACGRYVPRTPAHVKGCLTALEIQILVTAGLGIFCVQRCPEPGWYPSSALGTEYGQYAAQYASEIGLPAGMHLWLDLEGVAPGAVSGDIVAYCHNWASAVSQKGYLCGLYVGWLPGLNPRQIYDLPFNSYWKAYNYDDGVPTRGYQIIQKTEKTLDGITFDPDIIQKDQLGDLPMLLFPS